MSKQYRITTWFEDLFHHGGVIDFYPERTDAREAQRALMTSDSRSVALSNNQEETHVQQRRTEISNNRLSIFTFRNVYNLTIGDGNKDINVRMGNQYNILPIQHNDYRDSQEEF